MARNLITTLDIEYEEFFLLTITCIKGHKYIGMTIDYHMRGKAYFTMLYYIKNILDELPKYTSGRDITPAASHFSKLVISR